MLIAFDVGNTTTVLGVLEGVEVRLSWRIITRERTRDEYTLLVSSLLDRAGVKSPGMDMAGVCSVVPSETGPIEAALSEYPGVPVARVDWRLDCGIRISTDNPAEVGGDRIANAVGAYYEYGGPAIVVDMGTAITYDFVTAEGEYMGGAIAPGMVSGARELWVKARMLPEVELLSPPAAIGKNTVDALRSGIVYGAAGQIEGIVRRMWQETGSQCTVIFTGGNCGLVKREISFEAVFAPDLTLKGIAYAVDPGLRSARGK